MRGIYVERWIRTDLERLWHRTQTPSAHVRWDERFTQISYVPRRLDGPERNRYSRRLPFGFHLSGIVETTGSVVNDNGSRTTKIAFYAESGASPIESGTGYWRYIPMGAGYRFVSYFEYETRFGVFGRACNIFLRPLLGRATARSIDTLAIWLEDGIEPEIACKWARANRCLRRPPRSTLARDQ